VSRYFALDSCLQLNGQANSCVGLDPWDGLVLPGKVDGIAFLWALPLGTLMLRFVMSVGLVNDWLVCLD